MSVIYKSFWLVSHWLDILALGSMAQSGRPAPQRCPKDGRNQHLPEVFRYVTIAIAKGCVITKGSLENSSCRQGQTILTKVSISWAAATMGNERVNGYLNIHCFCIVESWIDLVFPQFYFVKKKKRILCGNVPFSKYTYCIPIRMSKTPQKGCAGYDTKLYLENVEYPTWLLLPGSLWPIIGILVKVPSM